MHRHLYGFLTIKRDKPSYLAKNEPATLLTVQFQILCSVLQYVNMFKMLTSGMSVFAN